MAGAGTFHCMRAPNLPKNGDRSRECAAVWYNMGMSRIPYPPAPEPGWYDDDVDAVPEIAFPAYGTQEMRRVQAHRQHGQVHEQPEWHGEPDDYAGEPDEYTAEL